MLSFLEKKYRTIKNILSFNRVKDEYDFNKSNPLGGDGERVDIQLNKGADFDKMDVYQKNHWKRYEFATEIIEPGNVCGDFACGTGYGSVMLSGKAAKVIGADLNKEVIDSIIERYKQNEKVTFLNENLLHLDFTDYFDSIISFETLEHFKETDIYKLLYLYSKALKENGRLIFSTPYMQEQNEQAVKMGFHLTFYINEKKIEEWLNWAGLEIEDIKYQNYDSHIIKRELDKKEFIICVSRKRVTDA